MTGKGSKLRYDDFSFAIGFFIVIKALLKIYKYNLDQ